MNINEEIEKIWEETIKEELNKTRDTIINKHCEEIELKLDNFQKDLSGNINEVFKIAEISSLKKKMNKITKNLIHEDDNNLINAILLCLSNIESFVYFCLSSEKNDILKKINEINQNSYFSLITELMKNLWLKKEDINNLYNTLQIHHKLKNDFAFINTCKNPGKIIAFILSQLNNEFNLNKNLNINNNINRANKDEVLNDFKKACDNNRNEITKEFFIDYQIKKKCKKYEEFEKYFYEQRPLITLYIQLDLKSSFNQIGNFNKISLKKNFNFLLNDNIDVEDDCEICEARHAFIINNSIQSLNNNILIINIDREKDPSLNRKIKYPFNLELTYKEDEKKEYKLISVLYKKEEKYVVYCKKLFNDNWIEYNEKEIKNVKNENDVLNAEKVLLLIYKKID